jgi:hypothetical protein
VTVAVRATTIISDYVGMIGVLSPKINLLIIPYKYQFLYNDNIKVILYIELKTVVAYAINVLSYKTKN